MSEISEGKTKNLKKDRRPFSTGVPQGLSTADNSVTHLSRSTKMPGVIFDNRKTGNEENVVFQLPKSGLEQELRNGKLAC